VANQAAGGEISPETAITLNNTAALQSVTDCFARDFSKTGIAIRY
jgi:hypothetical protein